MLLFVPLLASLVACSVPCEETPFEGARDRCLHQRVVLSGSELSVGEVTRTASLIKDPVLRDATVLLWVRVHRGTVAAAAGETLCGLLEGLQRNTCSRRLQAAHLSR